MPPPLASLVSAAALLASLAAAQPSPPKAPTLVDAPMAAASIAYLDGEDWVATAAGANAPAPVGATVPGDVISDLQRAGAVGDPNYELNWMTDSPAWWRPYTLSKSFDVSAAAVAAVEAGASQMLLVLDGVKMAGAVSVNGAAVGHATNQFLRYSFPLASGVLRAGANTISVAFDPADQTTEGRFMACSGGWDWAPYIFNCTSMGTGESGPTPTRALSFGLWKSVYVATVEAGSLAIAHVVPHVFYNGAFPVAPLSDADNGGFSVNVRVHMWAPAAAAGTLTVTGAWPGASVSMPVSAPAGESNVSVTLAAPVGSVRLWWPAGTGGAQPLYDVRVSFAPASAGTTTLVAAPRRIGFRFVALTTGNDTDAAWLQANTGGDGNANQGMVIRVNGAALMIRGANMIPIDEFEGRYNADALARMVRSSVEARMNLLRVWGGGVFAPAAFYDACDEQGILVYHDMQFAQNGHSPLDGSVSQRAEFQHQVRRLSAHPSIAIWDGCNECHVILNTSTGVYATFVLQTVVGEDVSRAVWPSCPSSGWQAGVDRLSSHPNGSPLGLLPNARPPPPGALGAPPVPANCTFVDHMDVDGDGDGPLPGATAQECCERCANRQPACASVVFEPDNGGQCWFKFDGGMPWPRSDVNRTTCTLTTHVVHNTIEVHGPYQHGSGFPAVNGGGGSDLAPFDPGFPLAIAPVPSGLTFVNVFTSEFGATGFSSFESMAPTLAPAHWGMHGGAPPDSCTTGGFEGPCNGTNVMAQRNYPQDNYLVAYYGLDRAGFDAVGADAFKRQTYLSQIAMALNIKMKIETNRARNVFGTMIWQLGEIWPTGGWGSLEYASPAQGGVTGGRWKPTHNWYESHLFSDVFLLCGRGGNCVVKNDRFTPFSGAVTITKVELATGVETVVFADAALSLPAGPGQARWFTIDAAIDGSAFVLTGEVVSASGERVTDAFFPLLPPANWTSLPAAPAVAFAIADGANADGSVNITLSTDKVAAFVTLTTLAQGRFSSNAVMLLPSAPRTVSFLPWGDAEAAGAALRSTLRLDHLAAALQGAREDARAAHRGARAA